MTLTRTVLASILAAFVFAGDLSTAEATHIKTFIDPQLTKAPVAGFRELVIDPAKVGALLQPTKLPPMPDAGPDAHVDIGPTDTLTVPNEQFNYAIVTIGDVKVGKLTSLGTGVITGVKPGTYTVHLAYPNGYTRKLKLATAGAQEPVEAVKPLDFSEGSSQGGVHMLDDSAPPESTKDKKLDFSEGAAHEGVKSLDEGDAEEAEKSSDEPSKK